MITNQPTRKRGPAPTGFDHYLRLRVDAETVRELDALEANLRGGGLRDISRSTLIRRAITTYLEEIRSRTPELLSVDPNPRVMLP